MNCVTCFVLLLSIIKKTNGKVVSEVNRKFPSEKISKPILNLKFVTNYTTKFKFDEEDRIVGGVEALCGEFPFIVSIQIAINSLDENSDSEYQHVCGGSILSREWIVTAAHCSTFNQLRYKIVAGACNLLHPTGSEQTVQAIDIIKNPQYDYDTVDYDIALIKVSPPFHFNDYVQPVQLPTTTFTPQTGNSNSAGWGLLHKNDKDAPPILQKITLPIISHKECNDIYQSLNLSITDRMICAGIKEGESVCNGDSGGPLLCGSDTRNDGNWKTQELCGLVSWGIACAVEGFPGVFTNVPTLLGFIREHVTI